MSTRAATKTTLGMPTAEPTPRKGSRAPKVQSGVQILDDALARADIQAMKEDYELEAGSHLRSLAKKHDERLAALNRHFGDALSALDARVRDMSLARYVADFDCDPNRALRTLVEESMRPVAISAVEQSARKRKRVLPSSPAIGAHDEDSDVFGTVKKARAGDRPLASARKAVPSSAARQNAARSTRATNALSPTGSRKTRLRIRPSQSTAAASASDSSTNFIYRQNNAQQANVAPTPARATASAPAGSTAGPNRAARPGPTPRQPRLGESIVMRSVNGSPLGEFVASDIEDDDDDDDDGSEEPATEGDNGPGSAAEDDDDDDWDLMDKNEASNVEHQSLSKSSSKKKRKGTDKASTGKGKSAGRLVKSASARSIVPSSKAFEVALPDGAPSFDALKAKWLEDLRQKLVKSDIGETERKRLEEVLSSMADL
ncbi:hypothetical protein BMF94_1922 [Rhodotorula taiwanensis]|uniref:Uncharacterized protein n=1 Tax=Rhodotorula taiwanensis TaxID=741276 RepID=A0A2S5BDT7_9BASI|nr:hypothetical protein BMF94_1922 [Rhodotorula taiwanensis]